MTDLITAASDLILSDYELVAATVIVLWVAVIIISSLRMLSR